MGKNTELKSEIIDNLFKSGKRLAKKVDKVFVGKPKRRRVETRQ